MEIWKYFSLFGKKAIWTFITVMQTFTTAVKVEYLNLIAANKNNPDFYFM